jgi:hypothetical protein
MVLCLRSKAEWCATLPLPPDPKADWLAQGTKKPTTYREASQSGVGCQACELASYTRYGCDEGYDGMVLVILLRTVL